MEFTGSPPTEEKCIAHCILPDTGGIIRRRIVLLPRAGRKDVLIAFVPSAVHNFSQAWVIGEAFELGIRHGQGLRLCTGRGCG